MSRIPLREVFHAMTRQPNKSKVSRRELFRTGGKTLAAAAAAPFVPGMLLRCSADTGTATPSGVAGIDRVTVLPGKTYLRGWAGYGNPPGPPRPRRPGAPEEALSPAPTGPEVKVTWSKASGPGAVTFADPKAAITTATFSAPGSYVLMLTADNGQATASSTLNCEVETAPPARQLDAVYARNFSINSPLWNARAKALICSWIPHCIDQINRTDLMLGPGGIDNFINAGKALRGEPHGYHKGYVFSNAWVHQTVESMSIALMIDPQGDPEIIKAHEKFRQTLHTWIPIILAAQEPDGYLQTAFTAAAPRRAPLPPVPVTKADGTVILARVSVSQEPDGTLRAARFGGRGGRAAQPAPDLPFDGKTSTTILFPALNQDSTITQIRLALFEGNAPEGPQGGGFRQPASLTAKKITGDNPDGKPDTVVDVPASQPANLKHWDPPTRGNHEGYTAGYFIESAINHYQMTDHKDTRLYNAAKKLADCWYNNLGPAPKKPWYDGHQEMEQALVRFGRFVNQVEGQGKGQKYIELAKFLLDCRYNAAVDPVRDRQEYDQSHLPVIEQYEAVGHAVRAVYTYSGMADVAVETHDPDYQSAVKSLWSNIVNKKYYITGGVGSGETSEGFGPNYSLRNRSYCESCSSCGEIFFQWKMNLAYHDAKYADLYEQTMYNGLLGSTDLVGKHFYYTNALDENSLRTEWHTCPCCVGNLSRTLLMFPTWTYARSDEGVYVNMFVGSKITVQNVNGTDVEMVQTTNYPWDGKVSITVNPKAGKNFTMFVRSPNRAVSALYSATPDSNGISSIAVNGSAVKFVVKNGYAEIKREWKPGDKIEFTVPLKVQRVRAIAKVEADQGKVALRYGPLMYNIEKVDQDIARSLAKDAPLAAEWKGDLLDGVVVIKGAFSDGSPMMAIPNYTRMNREPAEQSEGRGRGPRPIVSSVWIREA